MLSRQMPEYPSDLKKKIALDWIISGNLYIGEFAAFWEKMDKNKAQIFAI